LVTHAEGMADVRDTYMVHTMFRRELGLAPGLIRGVAEGDTDRSETAGSHLDLLCRTLHAHHGGEDAILWPLLLARGGRDASDIVPVMEAQHEALDATIASVASLLPLWRTTARGSQGLAGIFDGLLTILTEHMTTEERQVLPLAEKHITASEWEQVGAHGRDADTFSKKELFVGFGMVMYEAEPEVIKSVLAAVPLPVRYLIPRIAPRAFASHSKHVYGTPTPPRVSSLR
jgi:Hemerythrin HHE cation binding domain